MEQARDAASAGGAPPTSSSVIPDVPEPAAEAEPSPGADMNPLVSEFAQSLPFPLDPFQVEALTAVAQGESVLVAAPTGSGKTVVAEFACWLARRDSTKCFYTTPLKALSNQKFGDLIARHDAQSVGLLTGDNSINGDAPLVVMTTEVLRNMLYESSSTLEGLRWVVLDEVHYLQDHYRGAVWEEVLIHLPSDVRVVCLSATVSNVAEFGAWLETLRGTTRVVVERERPVELRNMAMVGPELYPLLEQEGSARVHSDLKRTWARAAQSAVRAGPRGAGGAGRSRSAGGQHTPSRVEVAEVLDRQRMLPAICFIFSRAGCDRAVQSCLAYGIRLTSREEAERIREFAEMRSSALSDEDMRALDFGTFVEALSRGISSHHAGMLPVFKETVEELFALGLAKLVFATETLSLGINMPARTVVIEKLTKFTGDRHEVLTPMDYTQLTGRAGRRGIDSIGYAVVLFNAWVPLDKVATLATVKSYPLTSSFRPSYNMAVNLVRTYEPRDAFHMLNSSFAQFSADRDVVAAERRLSDADRDVKELQEKAVCELGDIMEYRRLRHEAEEASAAHRGSQRIREAFAALAPGDVIWGDGLGKALVLEQPRVAAGAIPRLTVMTADRKLRRITARDFRVPPEPVARMHVRGQSWRSPKVRRDLVRNLLALDARRPASVDRGAARELVRAYESHPCHECPQLMEELKWAERLSRAQEDAASLRKKVKRRKGTLARTFERVLEVLRSLEYVDEWKLTPKGETLRRIYNESDLLVVECLTRGWFGGLDPEEMAAVASLFVYSARGRDEPESAPTPHLSRYQRRIANLYKSIADVEQRQNLEFLSEPDAGFMSIIYEWARGATLEDILRDRDTTAGDFVRWAKQVVDLLQQLRQVVEPGELHETLGDAVACVQRGVVAYSSVV
ncbi:MAG TPA: DEAD/DEAH box helicase [Actinomycetota bacterium]|nr:DEAD/DEAH box helicase [Actinomycetota bacterium]